MKSQQTIFIVITRGFIIRNILRSGTLAALKASGARVVVLIANEKRKRDIDPKLRAEFEDKQVTLIPVRDVSFKGYSLFSKLTSLLMYNRTAWQHSTVGTTNSLSRAWFWRYLEAIVFLPLSYVHILKRFVRWIEYTYFYSPLYAAYFDQYKPTVVFSTSVISKLDINVMKEARRRGIPTVSMPKGWDNVTRHLYRFLPDLLLVQNERMEKEVVLQQRMTPECVSVVGYPQFDWYARPNILMSREEFCKTVGLDPKRKIIFFGSAGIWVPQEKIVIEQVVQMVQDAKILGNPAQVFIRPHYSGIDTSRLDAYRRIPHVGVDDHFTFDHYFHDHWNPTIPETVHFTNLVCHADVVINTSSTLTLDAACFDKPIINIGYGALFHPQNGRDLTYWFYKSDHFRWVMETGGTTLVRSEEELRAAIVQALRDPSHKREERARLVRELCYKVDGRSSDRIAQAILGMVRS